MTRRTTVSAPDDAFVVLEGEALRRGVSLAQVLRELVVERATEIRRAKLPTFGIVSIGPVDGMSLSELSWRDEDSPARGD